MTTTWNPRDAHALASGQEVRVVTRRPNGTLRRPRTIWIVGVGDRVFIRSTNGPTADWYRGAVATGSGQIVVAGSPYEVRFVPVAAEQLPSVDGAYRTKYGRYSAIVDHLQEDEPRSATLEIRPA